MQEITHDELQEQLQDQLGWLRQLAHELIRDAHRAEDIAQDVISAALSSDRLPREPKRLRGWLRAVTRNLSMRSLRREGLQRNLELDLQREDSSSEQADPLEKLEWVRTVTDLVEGLREPYRETILLHFFEGLSPTDISKRLSLPATTIRKRLSRGLEMLRSELDRSVPGGREVWCLGLGNWLGTGEPSSGAALSWLATKPALAVSVSGVLLVVASQWGATEESMPLGPDTNQLQMDSVATMSTDRPLEVALVPSNEKVAGDSLRRPIDSATLEVANPSSDDSVGTSPALVIAGRIEPHDLPGLLESDINGWIEIKCPNPRDENVRAPITAGHWRLEFEEDSNGQYTREGRTFSIRSSTRFIPQAVLLSNGQPSVFLSNPRERITARTEEYLIGIKPATSALFEVVDAETGLHLGEVSVIMAHSGGGGTYSRFLPPIPSNRPERLAEGTSPIRVVPTLTMQTRPSTRCYIGAPGYAWVSVDTSFSEDPGSRRVELEPGGSLRVQVDGIPENQYISLVARRAGSSRIEFDAFCRLESDGEVLLNGLRPGKYRLSLNERGFTTPNAELTIASAEVRIGEEHGVQMTVPPPAIEQTASLTGTLVLPVDWGWSSPSEAFSIQFLGKSLPERQDAQLLYLGAQPESPTPKRGLLTKLETAENTYRFDLGNRPLGRYSLSAFMDPTSIQVIKLTGDSSSPIHYEVSPPVQVNVEVVDSRFGEAIDGVQASWTRSRRVERETIPKSMEAIEPGTFKFRVPQTELTFRAGGNGVYKPLAQRIMPQADMTITLPLELANCAIITLNCKGTLIPWRGLTQAEPVEHEGRLDQVFYSSQCTRYWGQAGRGFSVSQAGLYRIKIPKVDGYEQHPDVELMIDATKLQRLVIELSEIP